MKRRSFVAKLSSVGLLAGLPGLQPGLAFVEEHAVPIMTELLNVLGSDRAILEIGKSYYLSQFDSPSRLEAILFNKFEAVNPISDQDMRYRIGEDFRSGDTVIVNGWVLSSTEAQCCALSYLRHA